MYSMKTRIRYSESDSNGRLTVPALINYLQDCAIFHSEDVNYGVQYMLDMNTAWVLGSWQIDIDGLPRLGEMVEIQSYPYRFRKFMGCRGYIVKAADGDREYARANSVWSYFDVKQLKPVDAPMEMIEAYGLDEKPEMGSASKKINLPVGIDGIIQSGITITNNHIDTNGHVNNAQYVQFASAFIPDELKKFGIIKRMRAEYKKPVFCGDVIIPIVYNHKDTILTVFEDNDKNILSCVEFYINKC